MPKKKVSEKEVQEAVCEYLTIRNVFFWRNNTGAFCDNRGGFYRFGAVGSPDIIAIVGGYFVGIECKSPTGKQSEKQIEFQKKVERAGGQYILVRSVEDVAKFFDQFSRLS